MPRTLAFPRAPRIVAPLVVALAVACSGCGNLAHYRPTQSGRLADYGGLTDDRFHLNRGLGIQRNRSRNADGGALEGIDSFYVEPTAWIVDDASRAGRDPACRLVLTADLERALRERLGTLRPIVSRPGPRTAVVRSVIADARLSRPYANAGLMAIGLAGSACGIPIPLGAMFFGGACVEAEVLAPGDRRQVAAITCASGGGPLDFFGFFNRPAHAKKAMRRAAQELVETFGPR